jgi:Protein of unknown function (DUF3987)
MRTKTAAGLSKLWDGAPIRRVRAGDGVSILPGRRLALHLMGQPPVMAGLFSDRNLKDQGFLSRLLVCAPTSTAGTRFQRALAAQTELALRRYGDELLRILETKPAFLEGERYALDPRRLEFDEDAAKEWLAFADRVESLLASGESLKPVMGFANKLPEHVARIAGVLTLVDGLAARSISLATLKQAEAIGGFFAEEALRLFDAGACSPELADAEELLDWLRGDTWKEPLIGLKVIYNRGPNSIRDAASAKKAVAILEEHGWLVKESSPAKVAGKNVKNAWRIVREG